MDVLIVEDEREVAELIRESLGRLGYASRIATDAIEADQALRDSNADAVTLDLGMPGRSGVDWLEQIAAERPDLARRTVVITGMALESELVRRVARCGAGILAKPFSQIALEDAVRTQIARPIHERNGSD
jgi:two-component system OmpR family response regulator